MSKKNLKDPLDNEQRVALDKLHNAQITLEIALTIFIFSFFTIGLSAALPGYAIIVVALMGMSGLLSFMCGVVISSIILSKKHSSSPLAKYSTNIRRWLLVTWLSIPLSIFFLILAGLTKNAENSILCLILAGATLLLMLAAIICTLVGIHRIWKHFNKKKKAPTRLISYGTVAFIILLLATFGSYTTTEAVKYSSTSVTDSNLELGQTEVRQVGKDGEKHIKHNLLFGIPLSTDTKEPIDEIIAKGSRRYQYMYCSDGGYRYYNAEQFKDPNIGFTHQSPDACAKNGQGTQTTIADVPPAEKIVQQVPVYRSPSYTTCTESYFGGSFTCRSY